MTTMIQTVNSVELTLQKMRKVKITSTVLGQPVEYKQNARPTAGTKMVHAKELKASI